MSKFVLVRRGAKKDLPELHEGEIALAIDTCEVFIGSSKGNIMIGHSSDPDLDAIASNLIEQSLYPISSNNKEVEAWFEPKIDSYCVKLRFYNKDEHGNVIKTGCIMKISAERLFYIAEGYEYPQSQPAEMHGYQESGPTFDFNNKFTNIALGES